MGVEYERNPRLSENKPGKPVEEQALSQMGGTFSERKAAREGKKHKQRDPAETWENGTFASRKTDAKKVSADDAEDKSVKRSQSRRKS